MSYSVTACSGWFANGDPFRSAAQVVPTRGICESSTLFSAAPLFGIDPAAIEPEAETPRPIEPDAIEPAAIEPEAIEPAAIDPEAIEPAAIEPEAIEPAAIEPEAIEPAAIEPAAVEFTSAVSAESRLPGIEPYGAEAIPAGMDGSSAVIETELAALFATVTVTCCTARSLPSARACT